MKNKLVVLGIIIAIFITIFILILSNYSRNESYIKNEIEKANYCQIDEDCKPIKRSKFGCFIYVNKDEVDRINELVDTPYFTNVECAAVVTYPVCANNKCGFSHENP